MSKMHDLCVKMKAKKGPKNFVVQSKLCMNTVTTIKTTLTNALIFMSPNSDFQHGHSHHRSHDQRHRPSATWIYFEVFISFFVHRGAFSWFCSLFQSFSPTCFRESRCLALLRISKELNVKIDASDGSDEDTLKSSTSV